MSQSNHHQILVVGGGTAGITAAARLRREAPHLDIGLIEPASVHYYQPLFTLVGGGVTRKGETCKPMADVIPAGVSWIRDAVAEFDPDANTVQTTGGHTYSYDYLIVAPGLQCDWDKVKGLDGAVGRNGVCSNYDSETVEKTWEFIKNFRGGTTLFTFPNTPVKCAGAPQKIMYLAEDHFRRKGIREQSVVRFVSAGAGIFGVPKYKRALEKIIQERGIETRYKQNLTEIRPDEKTAVFEKLETGETVEMRYDVIHVTPPMSAPDFIKKSPLANDAGWVDVDKFTLQHVKYPRVFSLGDASSLPTSKTGAAVRKQAPVLVRNLLAVMGHHEVNASYNGYTSCPLVTGYGKLILAEFDYDGNPAETFPFDQSKERHSMYFLKKELLPRLYWHGMLKGRG